MQSLLRPINQSENEDSKSFGQSCAFNSRVFLKVNKNFSCNRNKRRTFKWTFTKSRPNFLNSKAIPSVYQEVVTKMDSSSSSKGNRVRQKRKGLDHSANTSILNTSLQGKRFQIFKQTRRNIKIVVLLS